MGKSFLFLCLEILYSNIMARKLILSVLLGLVLSFQVSIVGSQQVKPVTLPQQIGGHGGDVKPVNLPHPINNGTQFASGGGNQGSGGNKGSGEASSFSGFQKFMMGSSLILP